MAISFAKDIRPLFTGIDINHMSFFCDLASYDEVKADAAHILDRLKGIGGNQMPPASSGGPWPPGKVTLFETWINEGCQP